MAAHNQSLKTLMRFGVLLTCVSVSVMGLNQLFGCQLSPLFFTEHGKLPQDLTKKIIALSYENYGRPSLI